ncbi:hypothetical protein [Brevundimonas sp.]|uniref:hypothetical protein n=1 Tax=Brevundimonas sp. TaxID=1871086 RepID=UPI003BAB48E9
MADGGLTLHLENDLAERLRQAAKAAGDDVDTYLARALDYAIGPVSDRADDEAIAEETMRAGDGIALDDFLVRLDGFGRSPG